MIVLSLVLIGVITGLTTVLFGFGGGFVTVPVIVWADAVVGPQAGTVAIATSAVVMVVNASVATATTSRQTLSHLRGRGALVVLLAVGGLLGAVVALLVPPGISSWGFMAYVAVTIVDVLVRPGFVRSVDTTPDGVSRSAIPTAWGLPIGAIASLLGVGGSVMTVPLLRRGGSPMSQATTLANPLTLAISVPAAVVYLFARHDEGAGGMVLAVGVVDLGAAALLLVGAVPIIVLLRRRPPRIPDRVHAWTYVGLLVVALGAMLVSSLPTSPVPVE
ncbi:MULTISPECIES: sulfite exporter TauE/SafE family protein [unclassified Microbacterium]|uniref:sulfite exporter TauE/SafE family protein n=1 Tax=unclassified Microbacterium TaxID=2609290 RepID=UPI0030104C05